MDDEADERDRINASAFSRDGSPAGLVQWGERFGAAGSGPFRPETILSIEAEKEGVQAAGVAEPVIGRERLYHRGRALRSLLVAAAALMVGLLIGGVAPSGSRGPTGLESILADGVSQVEVEPAPEGAAGLVRDYVRVETDLVVGSVTAGGRLIAQYTVTFNLGSAAPIRLVCLQFDAESGSRWTVECVTPSEFLSAGVAGPLPDGRSAAWGPDSGAPKISSP